MKAVFVSRKGKYYYTGIRVILDNKEEILLKIPKVGDSFEPSVRELAYYGIAQEAWDNNYMISDGFGGEIPLRSADIIDTSHMETKETYEAALEIIRKINRE